MKVAFYTLGCKVNLYETEVLMNLFKKNNYEITDFNNISDVYVINTCTVTNTSDSKSRKIIRQVIKRNPNAIVVVMGCYSQVKSNEVKQIEGVDIIIGNNDKSKIIELINDFKNTKEKILNVKDIKNIDFEPMELDNFETRTRAFVKIQDGCDNYCSYCIIPYSRGNIRSKDMIKVIDEIKNLVNNGYVEVVLTGIHTGHYGKDKKEYDFSDLLNELCKINGLERIRISSIEITELDNKFMDILKNNKKIVNHLHIPLQSGCNKTLKDMNRKYDTKYFKDKINEIRNIRPEISITTDVIVGFPNESEEDFNSTLNFIKEMKLTKLHVFPFSKREGTKAAKMSGQLNNNIKKTRVRKLLEISEYLEKNYMEKFIGKELEVITEKYDNGYLIGYSSNYIQIKFKGSENQIGNICTIKINEINYPYLVG